MLRAKGIGTKIRGVRWGPTIGEQKLEDDQWVALVAWSSTSLEIVTQAPDGLVIRQGAAEWWEASHALRLE